MTYIPTGEGVLYLAAVEDCYSRGIVGWSMQPRMYEKLVTDALKMAVSSDGLHWPHRDGLKWPHRCVSWTGDVKCA